MSSLSARPPKHEQFVSGSDALLNQVEQQHHFGRVLQDSGLVVTHDVLRLAVEMWQGGGTY